MNGGPITTSDVSVYNLQNITLH